MYTILTVTALLLTSATAPQKPAAHLISRPALSVTGMTTWADVVTYFNAHATVRNAVAEAMLQEEAEAGVVTWECIFASSAGGDTSRVLDGSGIGWPSLGLVVCFATNSEMNTAANLVEAAAGYLHPGMLKFSKTHKQESK